MGPGACPNPHPRHLRHRATRGQTTSCPPADAFAPAGYLGFDPSRGLGPYDGRVEATPSASAGASQDTEHRGGLRPPEEGDDWTGLSERALPVEEASSWVVRPECGGVVVFTGTARDHSVGRDGVTRLEYEAYEEQVVPRLDEIAAAARERWPDLGRLVMLHRIGEVPLTEAAVVVAASAPHRAEAFEAARFGIDTLKSTVPIWKREDWSEGTSWGREAQHILAVDEAAGAVESGDGSGAGTGSGADDN